jgi:hypothetical protein
VPLAAVFLGHLPQTDGDRALVKALGMTIFALAFVPLVFGGTVYRMLEKIMTAKLVLVLGYLSLIAVTLVSWPVMRDVFTGFVGVGTVPLRAQTIVLERDFSIEEDQGTIVYRALGTWEKDGKPTGEFLVKTEAKVNHFDLRKGDSLTPELKEIHDRLLERARTLAAPRRFFVETEANGTSLIAEGEVVNHHLWKPSRLSLRDSTGTRVFTDISRVPEPFSDRFRNLLAHEGVEYVGLLNYARETGGLPPLDWAMVVAFIGIAGAGGLSNTLFSNYARDKGWGMGKLVGAIPSAIGGRTIALSHIGCAFKPTGANLERWHGWMRHILRDQWVWIAASILGMALPCMMSLEFIRNVPVTGDRVAAMTAQGIAARYPGLGSMFWFTTLACGFLVLAPGQVSVCDQIARRWTDMIWTAGGRSDLFRRGEVRFVYYGILAFYAVLGMVILWFLRPIAIAEIGVVLGNLSLGFSTLQALHVNRRLLPRELRPSWLLQAGTFCCGIFFLAVSIAVILTFKPK